MRGHELEVARRKLDSKERRLKGRNEKSPPAPVEVPPKLVCSASAFGAAAYLLWKRRRVSI